MPQEFQSFGKIERLRKVFATVTEKIDGTNAQILVPENRDDPVLAGSRTRWVTPGDDNFGFASWVAAHADTLRRLGPGRHYGEWYGYGIQRGYGLSQKRLALFNVERFKNGLPEGVPEIGVDLVPVLARVQLDAFGEVAAVVERLYTGGSVLVPGYAHPEGVIVQCAGQRWKVTDNGDEHKGQVGQQKDHVQAAAIERRAAKEAARRTPIARAMEEVTVERQEDGTFRVACEGVWCFCSSPSSIPTMRRQVAQEAVDAGLFPE